MARKHRLIAVPTGYNIYRVSDEVIEMHKSEMLMFPPAVVLEALVMQGMAKVVARIKPYDIEYEDGEGEEQFKDLYEQGTEEDAPPDNPGAEELKGPWYTKEEDDDA